VFAAAFIFIALLNFIPFVGSVVNYAVVLVRTATMTKGVLKYLIGNPGEAFDMKPAED
jgi:hypothetical protein